jgi:hypothetical protein
MSLLNITHLATYLPQTSLSFQLLSSIVSTHGTFESTYISYQGIRSVDKIGSVNLVHVP